MISFTGGLPLVYKFDESMQPIKQKDSIAPLTASFLEEPSVLKVLLEKEKKWGTPDAMLYQGMYSLVDYQSPNLLLTPTLQGMNI